MQVYEYEVSSNSFLPSKKKSWINWLLQSDFKNNCTKYWPLLKKRFSTLPSQLFNFHIPFFLQIFFYFHFVVTRQYCCSIAHKHLILVNLWISWFQELTFVYGCTFTYMYRLFLCVHNMFVNDQIGRLVYSLVYLLGIELSRKVVRIFIRFL